MQKNIPVVTILLALVFIGLEAAPGLAMRCGTEVIQDGSTKLEVLEACGEPMRKFGEDLTIGDTGLSAGADEKWVYDLGGGVYHIVYFDGYKVRKIELQRK